MLACTTGVEKCAIVVGVYDSPYQNAHWNCTGVWIQVDGKWNINTSHWGTASVSYDISFDNIVWAKPLTLSVSHGKTENRHHNWEIPNAHTQIKSLKPLFCCTENNAVPLTQGARNILHISYHCVTTDCPLYTAVQSVPPVSRFSSSQLDSLRQKCKK